MAELSHATRKKVGAILVSADGGIIAEGVNGMPAGFDNCCEEHGDHAWEWNGSSDIGSVTFVCNCGEEACIYNGDGEGDYPNTPCTGNLKTKSEVLHAELNAIMKVADSTNRTGGSTLYVTMCPCPHCVNLIIPAKIVRVVYAEEYRTTDGIKPLRDAGIIVDQYND
jgi:dCMP deaminase